MEVVAAVVVVAVVQTANNGGWIQKSYPLVTITVVVRQ
jgi:hypothetical protein